MGGRIGRHGHAPRVAARRRARRRALVAAGVAATLRAGVAVAAGVGRARRPVAAGGAARGVELEAEPLAAPARLEREGEGRGEQGQHGAGQRTRDFGIQPSRIEVLAASAAATPLAYFLLATARVPMPRNPRRHAGFEIPGMEELRARARATLKKSASTAGLAQRPTTSQGALRPQASRGSLRPSSFDPSSWGCRTRPSSRCTPASSRSSSPIAATTAPR